MEGRNKMKEEYKGYTIEYCEWNKYFIAKIGDTDYSNSDLTKVKKRIDDLDKENFKRTQVLYRSGWKDSKFDALTVTSESFERDDLFVSDRRFVAGALAAGARGYLLKDC